jgi:predicted cupin superfamily sugar epimerase
MLTAQQIIEALQLEPHPIEGGYFRETSRASGSVRSLDLPPGFPQRSGRSLGTSFYDLLTSTC